jgi:GntR family transcriptional regulator, transcriptional repressor for pyruvate dehydrogenase complex
MLHPVKKVSLTDSIMRQLISYIQTDVTVGEKLPSERKLIDMLQVGRTSLRESLRALEVLGIVETRAGEGTFVLQQESDYLKKPLALGVFGNQRSTQEVYEARRVIEIGMVPVVVERITDDEIEQCSAIVAMMRDASSVDEFLEYDQQFHRVLALSAKNVILSEVLKLTHRILEEERKGVPLAELDLKKSVKLHENIVRAVKARDPGKAIRAVETHMDWTRTLLSKAQ